jgi:tRNA threonylcarbamoyladenosine biosynthesis protein TsaB
MIVLAIDTCFARCTVLLYDSAALRVLAGEDVGLERGHAEVLAPMVQRVLAQASMAAGAISRIVVTKGPGSFTGLRIGLSFARALGQALGVSVIGVDTLHAVKLSLPDPRRNSVIAHKAGESGHFYVSHNYNSTIIELLNLEGLRPILESNSQLLLGTGAADIESHFKDLNLKRDSKHDLPNLQALAHFASEQLPTAVLPSPIYIREPDAKPQTRLRRAGAQDIAVLAKLHHASFDHGWSEADLNAMLAIPGTEAILVELSKRAVAFIVSRQLFDEAEILTLVTAPNLRKQGHAEMLVKAAQSKGAKLHLEVAASNTSAQALYAKLGFIQTGLRKAYYAKADSPAEDAVLMLWKPA